MVSTRNWVRLPVSSLFDCAQFEDANGTAACVPRFLFFGVGLPRGPHTVVIIQNHQSK